MVVGKYAIVIAFIFQFRKSFTNLHTDSALASSVEWSLDHIFLWEKLKFSNYLA